MLQVDPSVLFQASSIDKALTTLGTWMWLDTKVRLQVPELKTRSISSIPNTKFLNYLARSYCFLKVLSQWTQGRERWRVPDSWAATWDRYLLAIWKRHMKTEETEDCRWKVLCVNKITIRCDSYDAHRRETDICSLNAMMNSHTWYLSYFLH